MRKLMWVAGVSALAVLTACKQPPAEQKGADAPPAAPGSTAAALLSADQAFRMAFGTPAPAERTVKGPEADATEQTYSYKPDKLVTVGDRLALVSTATNASDCHACAGALAIHYFERAGSAWKLAGSWPEITSGNGFGAPPEWRLRSDLGPATWLQTETGWTGQGYTCGAVSLIELTPQGAVLRGDHIPVHYDNAGAVMDESQAESQDGTLTWADGKLRVTYTGKRPGVAEYEIVGGKFVRRSGHDLFQDC